MCRAWTAPLLRALILASKCPSPWYHKTLCKQKTVNLLPILHQPWRKQCHKSRWILTHGSQVSRWIEIYSVSLAGDVRWRWRWDVPGLLIKAAELTHGQVILPWSVCSTKCLWNISVFNILLTKRFSCCKLFIKKWFYFYNSTRHITGSMQPVYW